MEPNDLNERSTSPASISHALMAAQERVGVTPNGAEVPCPSCGGGAGSTSVSPVYALGRIAWRFPHLSVEKEFIQALARTDTAGLTDQQTFSAVISRRENRYLVRQLCWVLSIEGIETYILRPRDPMDLDLLIEAIRPEPSPSDVDAVIGMRGPISSPETCNGLMLPIVAFDQIYSFDRETLIASIPTPEKMDAAKFRPVAIELFERVLQLADNAGATDEHRAINYVAMRYPAIYAKTSELYGRDYGLTAVEARPSRLSLTQAIEDVIFTYTSRNTEVTEKFMVRVNVDGLYPYLVTKLSPYFDR